MHIMNNYNALFPSITLYNALYVRALSKVLPRFYVVTIRPLSINYYIFVASSVFIITSSPLKT